MTPSTAPAPPPGCASARSSTAIPTSCANVSPAANPPSSPIPRAPGVSRVAGADGETPGARGIGDEGGLAAGETFAQLVGIAVEDRADAQPGGGAGAVDGVIHTRHC